MRVKKGARRLSVGSHAVLVIVNSVISTQLRSFAQQSSCHNEAVITMLLIFLTSGVIKCKNNVAIFLTSSVRTTLLSFSLQVYSSIRTMLRFSHFKLKTSENVANRSVFV